MLNHLLHFNGIRQLGHIACFIDHDFMQAKWNICLHGNCASQYGYRQIEHGSSFLTDLSSVISKTKILYDWALSKT